MDQPTRCGPLRTLDELWSWQPPADDGVAGALSQLCRASTPLPRAARLPDRQRLLFCHDYAGGYGHDALAQGCWAASDYVFDFWQCLDVFVYFSHALVATPPVGWTNAGHANGAPVLGTFIVEWGEGAAVAARAFESRAAAERTAAQLAALAKYYGFDGWLVNVESSVEAAKVGNVCHFLGELRAALRVGESADAPDGVVLWYDACSIEGKVDYQCTLNDNNMPFFAEATGLFTDYHWQAHCCADAAEAATVLHSAEAASAHLERPLHGARDVWMGVDCYGRGTWGGGGMNCDAALACALRAGTSVAMFAAAWAYAEHAAAERERENWRFWTLAVKAWQGRRVMVHQLPLCTSFNRGTGAAYAMNGAAVHSAAWLNLSLQDAQPQWLQRGGRFETAAGVVAREPYGETQRRAHCVFEGSAGYECAAELAGGTAWSEELYACDAPVSGDTLHVTYACVVRGEEGLADCAVSLTFEDPGGGDNATAVLGPAGFSERGVVVCAATGELSAGEMQHRTCMEPVSTEEVAGDQGVVWQLRTYNVLVPSLFAALPPSSGAAPPPQALSAATYHTLSSVGLCVARRSGQDAGEGGDTQRCVLGALRIGDAPATDPRVADLRVTATHVCDAAAEASATTEAVASADSDPAGVAATDDTPEHNGNNRGEQALSLLLQWHDDGSRARRFAVWRCSEEDAAAGASSVNTAEPAQDGLSTDGHERSADWQLLGITCNRTFHAAGVRCVRGAASVQVRVQVMGECRLWQRRDSSARVSVPLRHVHTN